MTDPRPQDPLMDAAAKLLLTRAARLREKPEEEARDLFWAAEFPLGGKAYALPLETLVACQPLRLVTPVPLCDPHLAGIVRFQRQLLSVMSLAALVGSAGWHRDPSVMLILRLEGDRPAAVDCEEIPRTSSLPQETVVEARRRGEGAAVLSIQRPGQEPLHLIEISKLLSQTLAGRSHGQ